MRLLARALGELAWRILPRVGSSSRAWTARQRTADALVRVAQRIDPTYEPGEAAAVDVTSWHETEIKTPWGMLREMRELRYRVTNISARQVEIQAKGARAARLPLFMTVEIPLAAGAAHTLRVERRPEDGDRTFFFSAHVRFEHGGRDADGTYRWWKAP